MALLVDSSVWIAAAKSSNPECLKLKRLIAKKEMIYICRPIQTEVCQGARSESEFHKLWEAFLGFEFLEITDKHWGLSSYNYFRCRKKGITLTTLDCLIGTLAREYRIPLWSLDRSFKKAEPIIGYELQV
jgi:predicted nucleic acid-binding protein